MTITNTQAERFFIKNNIITKNNDCKFIYKKRDAFWNASLMNYSNCIEKYILAGSSSPSRCQFWRIVLDFSREKSTDLIDAGVDPFPLMISSAGNGQRWGRRPRKLLKKILLYQKFKVKRLMRLIIVDYHFCLLKIIIDERIDAKSISEKEITQ